MSATSIVRTIWCQRTRWPWRRLRSYATPCAARAWWVWAAWSFPSASAWSCSSREASGLLGTTLRYPYEVRDEEIYFGDIAEVKIPKDMLALAEHMLESKAAKFDSSKFHDRYEAAIVTMINEKKAGLPVSKQRELPRVVAGTDLMGALRQRVERAKET